MSELGLILGIESVSSVVVVVIVDTTEITKQYKLAIQMEEIQISDQNEDLCIIFGHLQASLFQHRVER